MNTEHFMKCNFCQQQFDMRELSQVLEHEHNGLSLKQMAWGKGDRFTTPETGERVFIVSSVSKYDVQALDKRSRAGYTIFSKSFINKL